MIPIEESAVNVNLRGVVDQPKRSQQVFSNVNLESSSQSEVSASTPSAIATPYRHKLTQLPGT